MSSLPGQGSSYDHPENLEEHQGWKQKKRWQCRGCFSNGAWQLSLHKLLWSVQKARTKEDKFCAAHKPHWSMSAQSRRPKSPVTQAWAWTTFPVCLLAKPPCAFSDISPCFWDADRLILEDLTYWSRQRSQNKYISVAIPHISAKNQLVPPSPRKLSAKSLLLHSDGVSFR